MPESNLNDKRKRLIWSNPSPKALIESPKNKPNIMGFMPGVHSYYNEVMKEKY